MDKGATNVSAYVTHGVLSGKAVERITESAFKEVVITDSIAATEEITNAEKVRQITIAPLIGEAIRRISHAESVSSLFD
jgi:ribose-phosphate pyrophosphokinase